jgi:branched-chain amino acid transport system permease protein
VSDRPTGYALLFAAVMFLVLPGLLWATGSSYGFRVAAVALIYVILAASMQLITGVAGLMSLGHAAFFGMGAYTAGLLATKAGWPFLATLPAAGIAGMLLGMLVALPTRRLVSIYFAVATLAIGQMVYVTMLNWVSLTNGPLGITGIPPIRILGFDLASPQAAYFAVAVVAGFALLVAHRCMHSAYGTTLRALREDDQCADAMGLNVARLKIEVFAVSCFLAGIAGALWAHTTGFVGPGDFAFPTSILILAMIVVGGLGSLPGAVAGAVLLILLPEVLRFIGDARQIVVGCIMFAVILYLPKGLIGEVPALEFARRQLRGGWVPPDAAGRQRLGWR